MMNWFDLVPAHVARAQQTHDLDRRVWGMRRSGALYKEIALKMGVSIACVRQRYERFARRVADGNPVEVYLNCPTDDVAKLAGMRPRIRKNTPSLDLLKMKVMPENIE